jgi:hypothetical protein
VAGLAAAALASWGRFLAEASLRLDPHSPAFLVACAVVGAGLAAAGVCGWRLAQVADGCRWRALLAWAVLTHLAAAPALPLTSSDLLSSLARGELQRRGLDAYAAAPAGVAGGPVAALAPARWAGRPSIYGPIANGAAALAVAAGARLGAPVAGPVAVLKTLLLLAALGTVLLLFLHLRRDGPAAKPRFVLVAFSPLLAWEISGQAHNDGLVVLALAAFVLAAARRREVLAAAALAAGALAKVVTAPLLALHVAVTWRRAPRRAALLVVIGAGMALFALAPHAAAPVSAGALAAHLAGPTRHAHSFCDLLCLALERGGAPVAAARVCWAFWIGSTALAAAVFLAARAPARTLPDAIRGFTFAALALFLTTPWFQPWYVTWLIPLLAVEEDAALVRLIAAYGIATVVLWAAPLDPVTTVLVNGWVAWRLWRRAARPAAQCQNPSEIPAFE